EPDMTRPRTLAALGAAALAVAIPLVLRAAPAVAATALPAHVYAPYFETWTTDSLTTVAQQSGARYLTLAFVEVASRGSCTPVWSGAASQPMASGRSLPDLASLRAIGGDITPSFGGFSADNGGPELADACSSVASIVAAYESVIPPYDVSRL